MLRMQYLSKVSHSGIVLPHVSNVFSLALLKSSNSKAVGDSEKKSVRSLCTGFVCVSWIQILGKELTLRLFEKSLWLRTCTPDNIKLYAYF